MRAAVLITFALALSACATYEIGETYTFTGQLVNDHNFVMGERGSTIKTDKGRIEFQGTCENAEKGQNVSVELIRDSTILDNIQELWTLENCVNMKAKI